MVFPAPTRALHRTATRVRLAALIAAIAGAAVAIVALAYLVQQATERQIAGDFNQQQLHLAREAAIRVEDVFVAVLSSLELAVSLAEDNPGPQTLSPHDLRAVFERLQERAPVDAVLLVEADGSIRRVHPPDAAMRPSVRRVLERLAASAEEHGPRVVLVPIGEGVIRRHAAVALPFNGGKIKPGALALGILDLDALLETHINSIRSGQRGYGWLLDGRGTLLHHPRHPEMVGRNVLHHDATCLRCHRSFDLEGQMAEGRTGVARLLVASDTDMLVAYHPIRLGREAAALLDVEFTVPRPAPAARIALRTKARQIGEELSLALGHRTSLERTDILGQRLAQALSAHPEVKAIRVWSATPPVARSRRSLLGQAPLGAIRSLESSTDLAAAGAGSVAETATVDGPDARELVPLALGVDLWSVAVAAPYSEVKALVRSSTLRIWVFSSMVLAVLVAAGGIIAHLSTARAKAEERAHASEEIFRMQEQMEQSRRLAALGEMVAQVAHEVRNPLLTLSSGLELLKAEAGSNPEATAIASNIWGAIHRLDRIVGDLLDFARPIVLDPVEADLHSVIDSALTGLRDRFAKGGIEVVRRYGTIPPINADTLRLSQLLTNLFVNSVEAMPQGGKLMVSTEPADGSGSDRVRVRIQDTGSGIRPDFLPRIFEPFVTTKKRGVGLGLAVVRRIVELHGGRIEATNVADGAEFVVDLPIAPPSRAARSGAAR